MTDPTTTIITTTPTQTVKVTYDGKAYNLSAEFTQDDDVLRQILSASGLAGAANALVERQADGCILLVKRGGPNGALLAVDLPTTSEEAEAEAEAEAVDLHPTSASVIADLVFRLSQLKPHINPAVQYDWDLRQQEWRGALTLTALLLQQGQIDKALNDGKAERQQVIGIESRLVECNSVPDQQSPGLM